MVAPVVACHESHSSDLMAQWGHHGDIWLQLWPTAGKQGHAVGAFQFVRQTSFKGCLGIQIL